ncbi:MULTISPECIES: type VI secretion system-associated protein VasI [Pseudomonas]|uniref:type VI secretion system-associated protein VasI n=1 Tax=Pseudomonas TaxID=286 RepID=UPI0018ABB71C|nr:MULTISPECIES: type VI secretion system-associated protein VasI [Pseudomonas]MBF8677654.1 type VI secretion system-associated protein TagO [Pseudomonas fulva]MBF8719818.1 type VI secretion system-associated protein TagO [Pseudomonas fulva]MBF8786025.1 type VI secretion system-associated protein TagO [Pseudomonas fulva]MBH3346223.1 type VI secretion system-associated protein TagO [Pseudomonas parafulva]MEC4024745.1 type VI secretion system-associated protein VasI [Pseudomonas fulva]
MKVFIPLLPVLLLVGAGCDAQGTGQVESGTEAVAPLDLSLRDCTTIVSAVERLACFDERDGTPPLPVVSREQSDDRDTAPRIVVPSIVDLVRDNEAARSARDDARFLITETSDPVLDQPQVVISAPALGVAEQRPYLAISCLSNITRLQLLVEQPIERNQIPVRLVLDERPITAAKVSWQVLEVGTVVDAGRGLVAIDQLRRVSEGARLRLESDYIPFDGLVFDASGLKGLVDRQREACHW